VYLDCTFRGSEVKNLKSLRRLFKLAAYTVKISTNHIYFNFLKKYPFLLGKSKILLGNIFKTALKPISKTY